jgi:hypothetical protein
MVAAFPLWDLLQHYACHEAGDPHERRFPSVFSDFDRNSLTGRKPSAYQAMRDRCVRRFALRDLGAVDDGESRMIQRV